MDLHTSLSRRGSLRLALGAAAALAPTLARGATPAQMQGPYYPNPDQLALRPGLLRDNDLTRVPGVPGEALGDKLRVAGVVVDASDRPVRGAVVEIWQACASGRYLAARDKRRSRAHDPAFQYFGVCPVDRHGRFAFRTIVPPAYPSGVLPGWVRPPHIHVRVRTPELPDFVTQLYWDDPTDPRRAANLALHRRDLLLAGVAPKNRDQLIRPMELATGPELTFASAPPESLRAPRHLHFPIALKQELYLP